jgi:hypothetical protein
MLSQARFVTSNITDSAACLTFRPCSGAGASLGIHGVPFQQMMRSIFERFVDEKVEACVQRCREDLFGMTRYSSFLTFDCVLALKSVKCAPVLKEFTDLTVPHSALFLCM